MRHKRDIDIAVQIFERSAKYYDCPHFDKKTGRMLALCACPVLPYYYNDIAAAWEVHCKMRRQLFSIRREYMKALQGVVTDRLRKYDVPPPGMLLDWPAVLQFLEPQDICNAALDVQLGER